MAPSITSSRGRATLLLVTLVVLTAAQDVGAATWCIARSNVSEQALQTALDYACGAGADCAPIQSTGLCFLPNTLAGHATYAFNSFYQRRAMAPGTCDFAGTATVSTTDPSYGSCTFPSSTSTAGGMIPVAPPTTVAPPPPVMPTLVAPPPPPVMPTIVAPPPPPFTLTPVTPTTPDINTPNTPTTMTPIVNYPNTPVTPTFGGTVSGLGPTVPNTDTTTAWASSLSLPFTLIFVFPIVFYFGDMPQF